MNFSQSQAINTWILFSLNPLLTLCSHILTAGIAHCYCTLKNTQVFCTYDINMETFFPFLKTCSAWGSSFIPNIHPIWDWYSCDWSILHSDFCGSEGGSTVASQFEVWEHEIFLYELHRKKKAFTALI